MGVWWVQSNVSVWWVGMRWVCGGWGWVGERRVRLTFLLCVVAGGRGRRRGDELSLPSSSS